MNIGEKVEFNLSLSAKVIGRTFEAEPKVDLKTPWGVLSGVPVSALGSDLQRELLPRNVTKMPQRKDTAA